MRSTFRLSAGYPRKPSLPDLALNGRVSLPLILIGPVNTGKSTLGALLAERLQVKQHSLDDVCWQYYEEAGYEPAVARAYFERGGQAGALEYMIQFYPGAVERIVSEHQESVIDLGAGHTVYDNPDQLALAQRVLAPFPNVVLILPSPDQDESIRILRERESNPHPDILALNEFFVRHRSNYALAKFVAYTQGRTPHETCSDILSRCVRSEVD